jgi:hypothetical protein
MRKLAVLLVTLGSLPFGQANADDDANLEAFVLESRAMVKAFATTLKSELMAAMEEGGPGQAVAVCNAIAPEIAADMSQSASWTIGRTSHRVRNPANAPDEWETMVLDGFMQRAQAGESLATMETVEVVESDGHETYRYMKAIPTGELCLTCHGTQIDPELKAQIDAIYPADQATGFELGELRGAFTITRTAAD